MRNFQPFLSLSLSLSLSFLHVCALYVPFSQRRYSPYSFPLSLQLARLPLPRPLASHPPLIFFSHSPTPTLLLLHFLLPSTTAYNGAARVNSIAAVISARLRRYAQLPRATLRRGCKSAVRGIPRGRWSERVEAGRTAGTRVWVTRGRGKARRHGGGGRVGGGGEGGGVVRTLCQELSASGKNSIPRLKGMTRSSGPYSRGGNFRESLRACASPCPPFPCLSLYP